MIERHNLGGVARNKLEMLDQVLSSHKTWKDLSINILSFGSSAATPTGKAELVYRVLNRVFLLFYLEQHTWKYVLYITNQLPTLTTSYSIIKENEV